MSNSNANFNNKYITDMWNDIIKFLTIIIIVHLLLCVTDDYDALFDEKTLKIFLYVTLGVVIYYLIIKKFTDKCLTAKKQKTNKKQNKRQIKDKIKDK